MSMQIVDRMFNRLTKQSTEQRELLERLTALTERAGRATAPQKFTFANRPLAADGLVESGQFAYITDGLDVGETTGNGTGVLAVYKSGADAWHRVADNTVVTT